MNMRVRTRLDEMREAMTFDDVENALYRVAKAISVQKFDTARAIAIRFLDQIGVQADLFPAAVARMEAVAAGSRDVASGDL
jgi:hypothetical protein